MALGPMCLGSNHGTVGCMPELATDLAASRDQTWMTTIAGLAVLAGAVAFLENDGEGPDGLVIPLLLLPVATFLVHAFVRRLPWWLLVPGAVAGPSLIFFLGFVEGSMFFLVLMVMQLSHQQEDRRLAAGLTIGLALVPLIAGLTSHRDSGWQFWFFGIIFGWFVGALGWENRQLVNTLAAQRSHIAEQAVNEERQRIARDIHDLVGHSLTVVLLHVAGARRALRRDPESAESALTSAEHVGRESLAEIRRSVSLLRSGDPDGTRPSPTSIDIVELIEECQRAGQTISYQRDGANELTGSLGLTAYRLVQEALSNAAKHAPDSPVSVEVRIGPEECTILVENDLNTTAEAAASEGGFGLIGMRERVSAAGGSLVVGPAGRCWRVDASLPIEAAADSTLEAFS